MFGTLAIVTTTASMGLKHFEQEAYYTFPLYYDAEYAWYLLGVYMKGLWSTYMALWFA